MFLFIYLGGYRNNAPGGVSILDALKSAATCVTGLRVIRLA